MPSDLSNRIVDFICGMPHCKRESRDGVWMARRLTDGTLIVPSDDAEERNEGIVWMEWAGDPARRSWVQGVTIAEMEIAEGIRRWVAMGVMTDFKADYTAMAFHFELKTGQRIACDHDLEAERRSDLVKAIKKFGVGAVLAVIKAKLGSF